MSCQKATCEQNYLHKIKTQPNRSKVSRFCCWKTRLHHISHTSFKIDTETQMTSTGHQNFTVGISEQIFQLIQSMLLKKILL